MDRFLVVVVVMRFRNVLLLASREKAGEYKSTAFWLYFRLSDCSVKKSQFVVVRSSFVVMRRGEILSRNKTFLMKRTYHENKKHTRNQPRVSVCEWTSFVGSK